MTEQTPDREALRERIVTAVWRTHQGGDGPDEDDDIVTDAVLAVVEPLLAENERLQGECAEAEAHHGRNARAALYLESERDEARAERDEARRVIAAMEALCEQADANPFGQEVIAVTSLRAALSTPEPRTPGGDDE